MELLNDPFSSTQQAQTEMKLGRRFCISTKRPTSFGATKHKLLQQYSVCSSMY